VEVDDHGLVGGKQALESLFIQCVWMLARLSEDQQIINVDDSDSDTCVSEQSGGGNSLESDFDTTSNKDNIGVESFISRESLPDGRASDTVLFGLYVSFAGPSQRCQADLFDREPSGSGVLGTDNQADVVLGSEAVVDSADARVGIGGEVDPSQASRKRDE
jgi:hypothetical protein